MKENTIIGYLDGKAIIIDEDGFEYFIKMPKEFCEIGEMVNPDDLVPVSTLSLIEQYIIHNFISKIEV